MERLGDTMDRTPVYCRAQAKVINMNNLSLLTLSLKMGKGNNST